MINDIRKCKILITVLVVLYLSLESSPFLVHGVIQKTKTLPIANFRNQHFTSIGSPKISCIMMRSPAMSVDGDDKSLQIDVMPPDSQIGRVNFAMVAVSTINLVKNCVGSGVFSLNYRVSMVSTNPTTIVPASVLIIAMATWASYNFYMVGETCRLTRSSTYGEAWSNAVSPRSEWLIQAVTIIAPIISCLANTIVLTDILGLLLRFYGASEAIYGNRNLIILFLSSFILFPISILKDLTALKNVSVFGIFGHLLAMATIGYRLYDGSYEPGGLYYPSASNVLSSHRYSPKNWFVLASLLSYCFVAHYNAPRYYKELEEKSKENGLNFTILSIVGYLTSALIYISTMILSLKLFGANSKSFALNSFSPNDPLGTISRLTFGASVLASFPLIFLSIRNWFIAQAKVYFPPLSGIKRITVVLLAAISLLTTQFTDIGVVGAISGSIFGSSMMFIFPPIMYTCALIKKSIKDGTKIPLIQVFLNGILLILGACLGLLGVTYSVLPFVMKLFK